ncbi:PhzF family phenazine biosynthesis protein [Yoonia sp. I 8.24]|uniref:PhzF family phenazine biosynthesis protein n=1 Tax=Yoonia sp. I 8.24 TaxID=1537229 RepID=UPI001EE0D688|nr:PhzF family phenazine biosynthesis protein [Yoonia sp. I 8.24]MCG3267567.1 PhzF family phenazine biosynthesis protein [Yoonia sp. I 8.24]
MTDYLVYDVFTQSRFGGNQLAVIPDARAIPEGDLQQIAREFNFSETTFVYPPNDPAHTAKVRIFTPTMEIAFAGHPTIGTAIALRDQGHSGEMVLELGVGPIPCSFAGDTASFVTSAALERISLPDVALVAAALGLPETAIDTTTHLPVQASLGLTFVIVALDSADSLAACAPNLDAIREGAQKHPASLDFAIYAYVREGGQIDARMFAALDKIPEDPATGSAAATLAALLTEVLDAPQNLTITQGVKMGRPSLITATTQNQRPAPVTISGTAVRVMEGRLVT